MRLHCLRSNLLKDHRQPHHSSLCYFPPFASERFCNGASNSILSHVPSKPKSQTTQFESTISSLSHLRNSQKTQIKKAEIYTSILQNSAKSGHLQAGQMAHSCILRDGLFLDAFIGNNIMHMYCKCGSLQCAQNVMDEMSMGDTITWNTLISGFVELGLYKNGVQCFREMKTNGFRPSQSTFVSVLTSCTGLISMESIEALKQVHAEVLKCGFSGDLCTANALLSAYCKIGDLLSANSIFDSMSDRDEISYEAVLIGYLKEGIIRNCLELFLLMLSHEFRPSPFAFSAVISACLCLDLRNSILGTQIHGLTVKLGLDSHASVGNSLITFYARSASLEDAWFSFKSLQSQDIISWNSLIGAYASNGHGEIALGFVREFMALGHIMNESTFANFLSACATLSILEHAKQAHALILKMRPQVGFEMDKVVLTMYHKSNCLSYASTIFRDMKEPGAFCLNLVIGLLRNNCCFREAFKLFSESLSEGLKPDHYTFLNILSCCTRLVSMEFGEQVHSQVIKRGLLEVFPVENSLLEMYAHCGKLENAERIFREMGEKDIFSWNTMILGYANLGLTEEAIGTSQEMREDGFEFNEFSLAVLIRACNCANKLVYGEQIHARVLKQGLSFDMVLMNSLLTMYSDCEMIDKALMVFEDIEYGDSASWNGLVSGLGQNGHFEDALGFYSSMNKMGLRPNHMTFASVTKSCAAFTELELGKQVHAQAIQRAFESDLSVSNSLLTMYGKCGIIEDSAKLFNLISHKDIITYNAMISAYAQNGYAQKALEIFKEMKSLGLEPNHVTFVAVLCACSHGGLVSEAQGHFQSMERDYGLTPSEDHYVCMVDILARAGLLREAEHLIESMPIEPRSLIWKILLSACRLHGEMETGERAAEKLMTLEPSDSSAYVLLSNIYNSANERESKARVRRMMKERGVKKDPGCSWICIKNKVHGFVASDGNHLERDKIYANIDSLHDQIVDHGSGWWHAPLMS
ncbi:pentatricopeptide repeat-containing protein At4g13650 [Amborella trichopoda]|uniref:pentatricopeptide repeat-containing protein At4g13650 n=1 Tax=Amborella trichopoda TaxID=13333 RepID=UPI0009BE6E1A|nr:pentatricopeptide repeat-containing protein At4g13650 [Amborella trichopoda]|eukprot:XP_011628649.2 pentatricopeptide repeat-containing protein At4g13650 [Amborella trichopoda]